MNTSSLSRRNIHHPITGTFVDDMLGTYECALGSHIKAAQVLHHCGQGLEASFCVRWGTKGREGCFQSLYLDLRGVMDWVHQRKKQGFTQVLPTPKVLADAEKEFLLNAVSASLPVPAQETPSPDPSHASSLDSSSVLHKPRRL